MTWVQAADESFQQVPIAQMPAAYRGGLRVLGGYAGGGSASKWETRARIDAWLSQGPDTGVAGLFEIKGTEPIDSPSSGATHARMARTAWRALGYPDNAAIFVAVDENVTVAEARAELTTYYRTWASADTCLPVGYVEDDAGEILVAEGILAAIFTPAAYAWNNPAVLYTPSNAPPHVVWTQERNGQQEFGADLDIGHIRTTAPIWWAQPSNPADGGLDMALTQADADLVAKTIALYPLHNDVTNTDVPLGTFVRSINTGVNDLRVNLVPAEATTLAGLQQALTQAMAGLPAAIAAAVVAALPDPTGVVQGLTAAEVQAIVETAATDVLGRTTAALTVAPPAAGSGS